MESDSEKEERLNWEFWESLTPEYLDEFLKELARNVRLWTLGQLCSLELLP